MVATSRFVEFSSTGITLLTGASTEKSAWGTRGYSRGNGLASNTDKFTVVLNSTDQLNLSINGLAAPTITLASGVDLDPRFVARDMEYKIHAAQDDPAYNTAQVNWRNGGGGSNSRNSFIIYSGELGSNGTANTVAVSSPGGRDARALLGFDSVEENPGDDASHGAYLGESTVSGVFAGQFDDYYTVMISDGELLEAGLTGGAYTGVMTIDGIYTGPSDNEYTITVDATNGSNMGDGADNVPTFTVVGDPSDSNASAIELQYADHFYDVSDLGVRVSFTEAPFTGGETFVINAFTASGSAAAVGTAKYIYSSTRGDSSKSIGIGAQTTQSTHQQVGTRGATMAWSPSGNLTAGDTFSFMGTGPQPLNSNATQLNFGNVTVSTASPVKVVWFELISGAVSMSTVKFSLQSDGSFQHHDQSGNDTEFHFGTAGAGNKGLGASFPTGNDQNEFPVDSDGLGNIAAGDIDSDSAPSTLSATKEDLAVVTSADFAQTIGNYRGGVVSDFMFLAIQLGANETGANSTINYRMFFDFS